MIPFARTRKAMNYKIIDNTTKYLLAAYTNKKTQESKSIQKRANKIILIVERTVPSDPRIVLMTPFARARKTR